MQRLIGAALDLGWTLWAYEAVIDITPDTDQEHLRSIEFTNWREREQAANLGRLVDAAPGEPLLVWCGNGHATKIVNQVLSYATVALVNEALMLGEANDVPAKPLFDALMAGAGSKALESFGPRILARQYDAPRVKVGDACLHMDVAQRMGEARHLARFVTGAAADVFRLLAADGHAGSDIAAVAEMWPKALA
jgi:hypothetical protein